jgi:2-oxoglutarate/2-oxoacid ferredoxin oxidoreductase subunit beta
MGTATLPPPLTKKDFQTDQEVRWCPGCGDYAILAAVQAVFPELGIKKEKFVVVSGIGCSSRFPYYMNTYGFHSIHGRAPTFATGLKAARPDLQVWVITGDGDGLSIGGNHLIHAIRRNIDLKIILFNNEIYGLTKGQYSPTSRLGTRTKSSPLGSIDNPLRPLSVAIGAEATFVARTVDVDINHLTEVLKRAAHHKGTAFVEIYQNCKIFNDGVFEYATDKSIKADNTLFLEHGKPLIFGKDHNKGIRLHGLDPEVVTLGNGINIDDLLIHDERAEEPSLAYLLSRMVYPRFPECIGVFRAVERPTYDELIHKQISDSQKTKGKGKLEELFHSDDIWVVQ